MSIDEILKKEKDKQRALKEEIAMLKNQNVSIQQQLEEMIHYKRASTAGSLLDSQSPIKHSKYETTQNIKVVQREAKATETPTNIQPKKQTRTVSPAKPVVVE